MEKMNKIEELKMILRRLKEIRNQEGGEGINEKIVDVQLELRRHLREQWGKEKNIWLLLKLTYNKIWLK